jgi:hypothetical protein
MGLDEERVQTYSGSSLNPTNCSKLRYNDLGYNEYPGLVRYK